MIKTELIVYQGGNGILIIIGIDTMKVTIEFITMSDDVELSCGGNVL